jgi:CubicO group peptidase (beta-lactamase class C family)
MRSYLSLIAATSMAAVGLTPTAAVGLVPTAVAAPPVALATCASATPAELASFFDSTVPARLQQDHAPGAVVSVVDHDSQLFAKGYGLADTARGVAFDPDRSLVRIASISKLFTFTAVMQQVQAGRIDLNADVNTYLTSF